MIDQDSPLQASQASAPTTAVPGQGSGTIRPRGRTGSALALKNWRVRWRLLALIAIPTVTAIALGGIRIDAAVHSADSFQHIEQLAVLGGDVAKLAQAMEDERDITAGFIAAGRPAARVAALRSQYATTDAMARAVNAHAASVGGNFPAATREQLAAVLSRIKDLQGLRAAAVQSKLPSLPMITDYSQAIAAMFALNDEIAQGSANPALSDNVRTLGLLSRMKDQASQQRAILYGALIAGQITPNALNAMTAAQAQQASDLATFVASTSVEQQQRYADTVTGAQDDTAQNLEQRAITLGNSNAPLDTSASSAFASRQWYSAMSSTIDQMRAVENSVVGTIIGQSRALQRGADRSALLTGVVVLLILILVLIVTALIARSLVRPLRRLRAGALDVAGVRLPEKVRQLSETGGSGESFEVEPIDVTSTDEVGEVARAFDQVHREALRLAANEAMLRGNVNAMFVSLSRRSQSLVERQIRLIDELEQGEQDAERLSNLFRMDHLATRMRRNSENLLVLAGHETVRRWGKPVTLVDVLRAAVSEIEQYERISLNVQPGTSVAGNAVNDVVHLLAELLENATSFSPGDTPVKVAGHLLNSGGVLLDITDQGVGMGAEEMAHANWRLENPPVVDVAVSRRMGLFVVARLAARHGIRVRLRQPELGGLTALIWLPDTLISQEITAPTTWLRRLGTLEPGPTAAVQTWDSPSSHPDSPILNAPALPANDWPAPGRPAEISPFRGADGESIRPADPRPPMRAADTGPITAADTGPMQYVQPMREISPVVVPAGAPHGPDARLPIYDSLESDWFNRRGRSLQRDEEAPDAADNGTGAMPQWESAGDEGWRAAKGAAAPSAGGLTSAGLPRRVPQANIVPGSASARAAASTNPALSAETARSRMASFQQGVRRARAAIKTENPPNG
jgi:signal transduction histidine kinase